MQAQYRTHRISSKAVLATVVVMVLLAAAATGVLVFRLTASSSPTAHTAVQGASQSAGGSGGNAPGCEYVDGHKAC